MYMHITIHLFFLPDTHLRWKQRKLVVSLQPGEEGGLVCDEIMGVVPMDSYPIAAPIYDEVMWEGPVVNPPHVVVTFNESPV